MASKKYYAVKQGRQTGIFNSWNECKKQVEGYPNAIYKGFPSLKEAQEYLQKSYNTPTREDIKPTGKTLLAYVDGSYSEQQNNYSFGCVLLGDEKTLLAGVGNNPDSTTMRNVAGELLGSMKAIKWAYEHNYDTIVIYHDYQGIASWANGEWKTKQEGTRKYFDFIKKYREAINIQFEKVKAHSGNVYNEEADRLASDALRNLSNISLSEEIMNENNKIFKKIMKTTDRAKNNITFQFRDYYISESKLKKFVKESWEKDGKDVDQIDSVRLNFKIETSKILWTVKDKNKEEHEFEYLID